MPRPIILKIGGSLLKQGNKELLRRIGQIIEQFAAVQPILIVPGGGPFADLVRHYGRQFALGEETCHFMALAAMDQYAYLLQAFVPGSRIAELTKAECPTPLGPTNPPAPQILLCSPFLRQVPKNELPRSWDVTSDSIAAYLAEKLASSLLVVLKSTDINPELAPPDVDEHFRKLLPLAMPVWFINGRYPEKLEQLLATGSTRGVWLPPQACSPRLSF